MISKIQEKRKALKRKAKLKKKKKKRERERLLPKWHSVRTE